MGGILGLLLPQFLKTSPLRGFISVVKGAPLPRSSGAPGFHGRSGSPPSPGRLVHQWIDRLVHLFLSFNLRKYFC